MLRQVVEKSRNLCHDLSPTVLQMNDLSEVLRCLARQIQARHGLTVHVDVPDETILRSETLAMFMFRLAQEMLFNVVRHAGVNQATLRLHRMRGRLQLAVADKGRGFDPRTLAETRGFGLLGIRERVTLLGGRMKIHGVKGRGSTVLVMIPEDSTTGEGLKANPPN
jgi:signal transduction histidine kinase